MLLTSIAEIAHGPLVLEPADVHREWEVNTWWLSADEDDRRSLPVPEVVAALEQAAERIRLRVRELGFPGVATFYVWHDEQAGQLRCTTGSVAAHDLPFGAPYAPTRDLGPVVHAFLTDPQPGLVAWPDLEETPADDETAQAERDPAPFPVWVRNVGTPA